MYTAEDIDTTLEIQGMTHEEILASGAKRKEKLQEIYNLGKWIHKKEEVLMSVSGSTLPMAE